MCIKRQRGLTLIELIVFILIVGVALAGVLTVLNVTARSSADPMLRKQALTIAEALMEEVQLQPFTWCDPDDPQATTAVIGTVGATGCTSAALQEGIYRLPSGTPTQLGPETGETRGGGSVAPFDNVNDYNTLQTVRNIADTDSAPYQATVSVVPAVLNSLGDASSASSAVLLVTVTVTAGNETISLEGYRTRHSPNFGQ